MRVQWNLLQGQVVFRQAQLKSKYRVSVVHLYDGEQQVFDYTILDARNFDFRQEITYCLAYLGKHGFEETVLLEAEIDGTVALERKVAEWGGQLGNSFSDEDTVLEIVSRAPIMDEARQRAFAQSLGRAERTWLYGPLTGNGDWNGCAVAEFKPDFTVGQKGLRVPLLKLRFKPRYLS